MARALTLDRGAWPAPAKINLFLHITGRRTDGYHELQTVFQFLDLCDSIRFCVREDGEVRRASGLPGVAPDDDLVVRAARALQSASGTALGVDIWVDKRVPLGAGLGGGSSDAATTLVGLNRLWRLGLPTSALGAIGLALGADIPVFVGGHAAWAEGVGERLTPIQLEQPWYLVLHPSCSVSTARVFADPELTRDTPPITIHDFLAGRGRNDCEAVVRRDYSEVREALEWLGRWGEARLTGTGCCVYSRCDNEAEARRALAGLPQGWKGMVARGLNRSPLLDRLAAEEDGLHDWGVAKR